MCLSMCLCVCVCVPFQRIEHSLRALETNSNFDPICCFSRAAKETSEKHWQWKLCTNCTQRNFCHHSDFVKRHTTHWISFVIITQTYKSWHFHSWMALFVWKYRLQYQNPNSLLSRTESSHWKRRYLLQSHSLNHLKYAPRLFFVLLHDFSLFLYLPFIQHINSGLSF